MASNLIRSGSRGDAAVLVQSLVNLHMADQIELLRVDGIFGPITARAVKAFQGRYGLSQDALVGPNTMGALLLDPESSSLASLCKQMGLAKFPTIEREGGYLEDDFEFNEAMNKPPRVGGSASFQSGGLAVGQQTATLQPHAVSHTYKQKRRRWKVSKFDTLVLPVEPSKYLSFAGFGGIGGNVSGRFVNNYGKKYAFSSLAGGVQWDPAGVLPFGKILKGLGYVVKQKTNPWVALSKYIGKEIGKQIKFKSKSITNRKIYFTTNAGRYHRASDLRRASIVLQLSSSVSFLAGEMNVVLFGGDLASHFVGGLPLVNMLKVRAIAILGETSVKPMPESSINWVQFDCNPRRAY